MNALFVIFYVLFAVGGSTLIKYGGTIKNAAHLVIPVVNISISWASFAGIISYGLSFLLYIVLLNKFELSFISPLTVGIVYVLLMITAIVFFNEQFTLLKTAGCTLILLGIMLIVLHSK